MSDDSGLSLTSILDSVAGNLATDATKALSRRTSNSRVARATREFFGIGQEHAKAKDIFCQVITRAQARIGLRRELLNSFLREEQNRVAIYEWIVELPAAFATSDFSIEWATAIADRHDLASFGRALYEEIREVRKTAFSPETWAIIKAQERRDREIKEYLEGEMSAIRSVVENLSTSSGRNEDKKSLSVQLDADPSIARGSAQEAVKLIVGYAQDGSDYKLEIRVPAFLRGSKIDDALKAGLKGDVGISYISKDSPDLRPRPFFPNSRVRPLHLGLRIGAMTRKAGTLGAFVELSSREPALLIPKHLLLGREVHGSSDSEIAVVQPVDQDELIESDVIAFIAGGSSRDQINLSSEPEEYRKTSVAARLRYGVDFIGNRIPSGYGFPDEDALLAPMSLDMIPPRGTSIFKIGSTTGWTEGKLSAYSLDGLVIQAGSGSIKLDNLIEIESLDGESFSRPGDSGGLVYLRIDGKLFAVGLVVAGGVKTDQVGEVRRVTYCLALADLLAEHSTARWWSK